MHNLLSELRAPHNDEIPRVEVEIIGRLKERKHNCFTSRFVIEVDAITPVGSLEVVNATDLFRRTKEAQ